MGKRPNLPIIGRLSDGRPVYLVAGAAPDDDPAPVRLPDNLKSVDDDELAGLHARALAEFDGYYSDEAGPDISKLERATELTKIIGKLNTERERRDADAEKAREDMDKLRAAVRPQDTDPSGDPGDDGAGGDGGDGEGDGDTGGDGQDEPADTGEVIEGEIVPAAGEPAREPALTASAPRLKGRSLNQHLRGAASRSPNPRVPTGEPRDRPVLVAASDIPEYRVGTRLPAMRDLALAMKSRARNLSVTDKGRKAQRYPIAYTDREFSYELDEKATPQQINEVLTAATNPDVLVAAGGWCAPPETSYDFYNIVCEDGLVDLPTIGVPRGSIQWPISPSFHDVSGADDNPWTWTNQDDIDALTQESVRKPCQRIDCPTLDDATLSCDGICLTVGNLTDFAWPELVENHVRLLMAAQAHYMNTRKLSLLVAGSTAVTPTVIGDGVAAPILSSLDLQAIDIRERFRMCEDDVIEAILPRWVHGAVAADLALRQGRLDMALGRRILADWLDTRNIRAQFVTDWQIGSAGQPGAATAATDWPGTVDALVYPPGTWVLGQGLRLNLGVIRDSVLNESNDHTAAWMEDCYLVAKIGHVSRLVTIDICPNGVTNAGEVLSCAS